MKRALAIYGSPRREGTTARLHDAFLAALGDRVSVRRLHVYDMDIRPCTDCGHCRGEFGCIHDDDMSGLYDAINGSDLLSVSSPLYFSSLPAPLKAFVDRCQVLWELSARDRAAIGKKRGYFMAAGAGDYPRMFDPSVIVIRHFFNTLGCTFNEDDYLLVRGADGPATEHLERARALGEKYSAMLDEVV